MKKIFLLFSLVISTLFLYSQAQYEDVVYLKNGSVIRGLIIEQVPNETIKIKTQDRNIFVYKIEEIEKITKEELDNKYNANVKNNNETNFSGHVELGPLLYANRDRRFNNLATFSFRTLMGGKLSEKFTLGAELGVDAASGFFSIPMGIAFRASFIEKSRVSPILDFGTGYTFNSGNTNGIYSNGIYFSPAMGAKFRVKNIAPFIKLGYFGNYLFPRRISNGTLNNAVVIKFGVEF